MSDDLYWFGRVPSRWETPKLSYLFGIISSGTTPESGTGEYYGGDIPWVTTSELRETAINATQRTITLEALHLFTALRLYPPKTILIAMYGATIGRIGVLNIPATTNQACCALAEPKGINPSFAFYVLLAARKHLVELATGGGQKNINQEVVRSLRVPLPILAIQTSIADFLDRETAKIDALIAKQTEFLTLLDEHRRALVIEAVTKGLDPTMPMQETGVGAFPSIPRHWQIRSVQSLFALGRGRVISQGEIADNPGGYPVYSSQTENDGVLGFIATFMFDGDYLTWTTDGANAGTVFRRSGQFNCTNVCGTMKARQVCDLSYLRYALTLATKEEVRPDINPKLMNNVMARIRLPFPPVSEQVQIAATISRHDSRTTALAEKARTLVAILQERRSALITAAVTGQIDVTQSAPKQAAA